MLYFEHPDFSAFLAAVLDEPGDDTRRLGLADWLDEFDTEDSREQARHIRVSIGRYTSGDHATDWITGVFGTRRGFVECVRCDWDRWIGGAANFLATRPICHVDLTDASWLRLAIEKRQTARGSEWVLTARVDIPRLETFAPLNLQARTMQTRLVVPRELLADSTLPTPTLLGRPMVTGNTARHEPVSWGWEARLAGNTPADRTRFVKFIPRALEGLGQAFRDECAKRHYHIITIMNTHPGGLPDDWRYPGLAYSGTRPNRLGMR